MTIERYIVGPPGTGKTTRAKKYVEDLINGGNARPDEICLVSFTNAAAQTLRGRAVPVPRQNIGTLHSFAFRAGSWKKEQVAESKIDDWNACQSSNYWLGENQKKASPEYDQPGDGAESEYEGDELMNRLNILRARMTPRAAWPLPVAAFSGRWEKWKLDNNLIDFTDMIEYALLDFDSFPGEPRIIIADESQDFSPLEMKLLRKWAARAEIINWIGDADQILYEFKGVDPKAFMNMDAKFKQVLEQSFRVPKSVHKVALGWINRAVNREKIVYHPTDAEGTVARLTGANWKEPDGLIKRVEKVLKSDQECMILASCAYMLDDTVRALRAAGIPFHNPNRKTRGDWNPLDGSGTTAAARLLAYLRPSNVWGEESRFYTASDLQKWVEPITAKGTLKHGAKAQIERLDPEREIEISDLLEWFEEPAIEKILELDTVWYESALNANRAKSFVYPFQVMKMRGAEELLAPRRVKIGTIHSFKGDESQVVFMFPDLSKRGMNEWESGGANRDRIYRQFYVALTRSSDKLYVLEPESALAVRI